MKNFKPVIIYIDICLLSFCFIFFLNRYESKSVNNTINSDILESTTTAKIEPDEPVVKKIALTFDDGPHSKYTMKLLDGLKARNVKATFFILGVNAERSPEILKRMNDDGHVIGNHTYSHVKLTCISKDKAIAEILNTSQLIYDTTGQTVKYIRPPYGFISKSLKTETNLTPIMWTIDPRDWSVLNTKKVTNYVVKHAKNNDIILLHDIFDTSVDAALQIVDQLQAKGFTFVTIDELDPESYELKPYLIK